MKFADLHLHTLFSDGTYTPGELVYEAVKQGLTAIAVTDHDTVAGVPPTLEIAKAANIELLAGIELTAEYDGSEIHILGYLIDYLGQGLQEKLAGLGQNRLERIHKIVKRLNSIGIGLRAQEVFDIAAGGIVGRLHVARAMLAGGWVDSIPEAFRKYIGEKCPAYVCGFRFSPLEAIKLIKEAGGIPVLAHPYTLNCNELIVKFIKCGLMGLEVYYTEHTPAMTKLYLDMAKKFSLLITGGSDCHGLAKSEAKMGSIKIPYELVECLKAAKEKAV